MKSLYITKGMIHFHFQSINQSASISINKESGCISSLRKGSYQKNVVMVLRLSKPII